ncbi:PREDICTED: fatty acid 2-hydroxylase [Eufriesea mexicana]|nr:PREDICTED: fatty acid 2-hydroxylase [Eufriesea mexicana]
MARQTDTNGDVRKRTEQSKSQVQSIEDNKNSNEFLIKYQNQLYNIHDFLSYHPGGKKVLNYFKNRSLDKVFEENPHSKAAFHLLEEFTVKNQETYQKYENLIDWNAAILPQVGSLGHQYWEWVNLPVNRNIRLFDSKILENITITPWYLIPIIWIPIVIYFVYTGWMNNIANNTGTTLFESIISYVLGIFMWSLVEYVLHRELFHFKPPTNSKLLISFHFLLHGVHHKAPFDGRRLVFPPIPALIITRLLVYIYEALFPQTAVSFIMAGTVTGYICYDLIHYYLHHGAPKDGTYMYLLKRSHNYHHFLHHDLGYGISSKLWDYVFGTNICLRQLTKPIEW